MPDSTLTRIIAAKHCGQGHTWREIGRTVGMTRQAARRRYQRRDANDFPDGTMPAPCPICSGRPGDEQPGIRWEETGNYAEAASTGHRIQTLEALLAAAEVDLDQWTVHDWGVKKWEVGAKIKEGHLEWDDSRMTGHLDYQGLGVQDLWSVWAKFLRKEPVFLQPVLQPVECSCSYKHVRVAPGTGTKRALIGADAQLGFYLPEVSGPLVPFHDRAAIDAFLQLAADLQPDLIILLGDWNDFPEWTDKFVRSPEFQRLTQPAIEEGHWIRRRLREACPRSRIEEHEGNHEKRMPDFIAVHLAAAANLKRADEVHMAPVLSVPYLLALDALGITWVGNYPNDDAWINDELRVIHGDTASSVPGGTARKYVDESEESVIFGHIHRRESASLTKRTRQGIRTIEARGIGCLCRIDGAVPARSERNNWQQSVAIVDYTKDDHNIYDVEIKQGRAIWNGRVFHGHDYTEALRQDNDRWNW
jgi:hypothetical protein